MNVIDGMNSIAPHTTNALRPNLETTEAASPFSSLPKDAIGQVESLEGQARDAAVGLMKGEGIDVHQAVIASQKAQMAFELALSVRNKALQAYQSVMGMQF